MGIGIALHRYGYGTYIVITPTQLIFKLYTHLQHNYISLCIHVMAITGSVMQC